MPINVFPVFLNIKKCISIFIFKVRDKTGNNNNNINIITTVCLILKTIISRILYLYNNIHLIGDFSNK